MSASVWRKCRLRDIAYIYRGGNFQKNDFTPEGKPCIHYGQMYTHFGTFTDKVLTYLPEDIFKKSRIAVSNDVIMAITSETVEDVCSCVAWIGKEDIAISGHTAIIHHQQDAKFLSYYFHSDSFFTQKSRVAHGSKVIEMNPSDLEKTTIIFPKDPEEQQRIASILSTCDTVIQKTQKTIDKYKAIKQGMMQDLFTRGLTKDGKLRPSFKDAPELYKESELGMIPKEWEVKELGECSNKPEYGLNTPAVDYDGHIGYLRITDIDDDSHRFIKDGITSPLEYSEEYKLFDNDLVFARTGASVGKTYLYSKEDGNLYFAGFLIKFRILDNYSSKFIYYHTLFPRYKNWVVCYSMRTGQPGVNAEEFATFKLPIPSKTEQTAIAARLSSMDVEMMKFGLSVGLP